MVDNVTADPGSGGATFKTDEDTGASAHVPVTKIELGTNNSFDGFVAAGNPMPSQISDGTNTVKVAVEDAAHVTADGGIAAMAVRSDTLAALAGTTGDYTPLQVNADGALYTVVEDDVVDSNNSTTSTLLANTDYTGTGTDILGYAGVTVTVFADQNSDANGMRFEFSSDNSNWDISQTFDYIANTGRQFQFGPQAQYFRVAFQNGGTNQTAFRLQTVLHRQPPALPTIHRADADIAVDRSATLVKSIIMAQAAGSGDFTPVDATAGGSLKISVEEGTQTPADNDATPTDAIHSQSFNMVYDGATWDMARGDATNGLLVNLGANNDITGTVTANAGTGTFTVDLGANNDVTVTGGNAHDGTTLGNPVLGGARATNSVEGITQVANADLTHIQADLNGVLITRPHTTLEEIITERVSDTAGTSTNFTNFAAGGVGVHNYVTTISIYNSSATDGYVDFRDGSAGSVIFTAAAPATGGSVINLPVPLKGAANTALAYDVSGALSTVYISVVGFQAQG